MKSLLSFVVLFAWAICGCGWPEQPPEQSRRVEPGGASTEKPTTSGDRESTKLSNTSRSEGAPGKDKPAEQPGEGDKASSKRPKGEPPKETTDGSQKLSPNKNQPEEERADQAAVNDAKGGGLAVPMPRLRTWVSADGNYSVEASFG